MSELALALRELQLDKETRKQRVESLRKKPAPISESGLNDSGLLKS
jgi:hypothetical protein